MSAYFVAVRDSITDPKELQVYGEKAGQSVGSHKIMPLAVYGRVRSTEGLPVEGAVILKFDTFAEAEAWYDSPGYQDAMKHRMKGGKYRTFIVEGM